MNSLSKKCDDKVKDIGCIVDQVYKLAYSYNQLTCATDLLNRIAPVRTGQVKDSIRRVTRMGKSIDQLESILNYNIKELKELYHDGNCCDEDIIRECECINENKHIKSKVELEKDKVKNDTKSGKNIDDNKDKVIKQDVNQSAKHKDDNLNNKSN